MAMAFLSAPDSRDADIEDEIIRLSQPDQMEAESLPHHVEKCASRFRLLALLNNKHGRQIARTNFLIAIIGGWMIFTSEKFLAIASAVISFMSGVQ